MPGLDRTIDPTTGDYVDAVGGAYAESLTIATAVYHQIKGELDRWPGDPNAGSGVYRIKQLGTGKAGQRAAEDATRAALQGFVDRGDASDLAVAAEGQANGRMLIAAELTDVQYGPVVVATALGTAIGGA